MEEYNKSIRLMNIELVKTENVVMNSSFKVKGYQATENILLYVNKGTVQISHKGETARSGDIVFLPQDYKVDITFGEAPEKEISNADLQANKGNLYTHNEEVDPLDVEEENYILVYLKTEISELNFFVGLQIADFAIYRNFKMGNMLLEIYREDKQSITGSGIIKNHLIELVVVELFRYMLYENLFVAKLSTNISFFKDVRLVRLFKYISDHLTSDLSNKNLAAIAGVSEDYVGQYFKTLTGINPQDYIEYERMEKAVGLLKVSRDSIREIGQQVGYKDTAYFCRRFKMMFGIPAGKMRRREIASTNVRLAEEFMDQ